MFPGAKALSRSVPFFSVVSVTLNPDHRLSQTVRSVLDQEFANFEYVIKDGGSKDGTLGYLPQDFRLRVIIKPDKHIFDAMNQALDYCRGRYVFFLNAGDRFHSAGALGRVVAAARSHGEPDVLYCYYEQNGQLTKYPKSLTTRYLYRSTVCHQSTFVKRECLQRFGGFDPSLCVAADDELLARLILKHRVTHHLCSFPVTICAPWGYSLDRQYTEMSRCVREQYRRAYLTPGQRFWAKLVYAATLPGLRNKWMVAPPDSQRMRAYVVLSNFFRRFI